MRSIYTNLKQQLLSITNADGAQVINHVALWNRQTEFLEKETPFRTPAIFIEFGKITWKHQMQGIQDAELPITLHIVTPYAPEGYDGGLLHLEICQHINHALHGYKPAEHVGTLTRVSTEPCHDHEDLLLTRESYSAMITDFSGCKQTNVVEKPTPHIVIKSV